MATTNLDHTHHYHLPSTAHYFNPCHPATSQHDKSSNSLAFHQNHHNQQQHQQQQQHHHHYQTASFSQKSPLETSIASYAHHMALNEDKFQPEQAKQQLDFEFQRSQTTSMIDRFMQNRPTGVINQQLSLQQIQAEQPLQLATGASGQQAVWTSNSSPKSSTDSVQSAATTIQAPLQVRAIQLYGRNGVGANTAPPTASQQHQQQLQCLENDLTPLVKFASKPLDECTCGREIS